MIKKRSMGDDYFSSNSNFCTGYADNPNDGRYTVLPSLSIASIKKHGSSHELEKIVAFDAAEVSFANLGKINVTPVSSFISPNGRLAGYDFFSSEDTVLWDVGGINICSLNPLMDTTSRILGTKKNPVYPILAGSMVPCASKEFYSDSAEIYSGLSISVPKDKSKNPFVLMEDAGFVRDGINSYLDKIVRSSLKVCEIQGIEVDKIYVARKTIRPEEDELACALVICPYIHLSKSLKGTI